MNRQRRRSTRGRVVTVVLVLLVVAVIIAIAGIVPRVRARSKLAAQTDALAAPVVIAAQPRAGEPTEEVILPSNVQAFTDSPIYARTNGYLKKWYFDIGAHVKKGQLLADIESPEIDQQLAQAQADLATATTNAQNAATTSKRYQDLLKQDAVSKQETENFTTQALAGNTAVRSAQANVQRVQQLVDFEKVYAPFDGVLTARNVDTGQLISAGGGNELFHMAALDKLRVYINVPQIYSRAAVRGLTADITFDQFPGRRFQGRLVRTSDQIDPTSRTLLVEVDIDNRKGELLPGAYAEVHLKLNSRGQSYMIPVSALMFRSEGLRVGTVVNGNQARLMPVVLGHDDGRMVQVISGLDAQSEVIQDPPDSLIDGEKVQVTRPEPARPGGRPQASGTQGGGAQGGGQSGSQGAATGGGASGSQGGSQDDSSDRNGRGRRQRRRRSKTLRRCSRRSGAREQPRRRAAAVTRLPIRYPDQLTGLLSLAAACLLLSGCMVGPNYRRPAAPAPPSYKESEGAALSAAPPALPGGQWKPAQPSDTALRGKWWEIYNDPQLNALEEKVAVSNQTLKAATQQYVEARATIQQYRANLFPTLGLGTSAAHENLSGNRPISSALSRNQYNDFTFTGQAAWEPDFWGRIRRTVEAARSTAQASAADVAGVELSLRSELALDYFQTARTRHSEAAARRDCGQLPTLLRSHRHPIQGRRFHAGRRRTCEHSAADHASAGDRCHRCPGPV